VVNAGGGTCLSPWLSVDRSQLESALKCIFITFAQIVHYISCRAFGTRIIHISLHSHLLKTAPQLQRRAKKLACKIM